MYFDHTLCGRERAVAVEQMREVARKIGYDVATLGRLRSAHAKTILSASGVAESAAPF